MTKVSGSLAGPEDSDKIEPATNRPRRRIRHHGPLKVNPTDVQIFVRDRRGRGES